MDPFQLLDTLCLPMNHKHLQVLVVYVEDQMTRKKGKVQQAKHNAWFSDRIYILYIIYNIEFQSRHVTCTLSCLQPPDWEVESAGTAKKVYRLINPNFDAKRKQAWEEAKGMLKETLRLGVKGLNLSWHP